MYYKISETLIPCGKSVALASDCGYVAVLTPDEWEAEKENLKFDIDLPLDNELLVGEKAEVYFDSFVGGFHIPEFEECGKNADFIFAVNKKGIIFVDRGSTVDGCIKGISENSKWKVTSLERFIFIFLSLLIKKEFFFLRNTELKLNEMEAEFDVANDIRDELTEEYLQIRKRLRNRSLFYEQLVLLGEKLEENENGFFTEENLCYFRVIAEKAERLKNALFSLREYTVQIRDQYRIIYEFRRDKVLNILTIVTSICAPASLVVGWYGMNFKYMPELNWKYSYPILFVICVVNCLITIREFRKLGFLFETPISKVLKILKKR